MHMDSDISPPLPALVSFAGIQKTFAAPEGDGTLVAVEGVDLTLEEGHILTILGPSGCGKSTLLNMLAGIYKPTRGTVTYRGAQVSGLNLRTGYMTQNDHLLPWRRILANVRAPYEIAGMPRRSATAKAMELIDLVGLTGFENAYPTQVSGGMRKRASLARLLAYNPETLLLDEPFVALDAQLRLAMQAELRSLARRLGKTVLFVTHDVDEAAALGDKCAVFTARPGRIRQVVDIDLPADRDLMTLRQNPDYGRIAAKLWDLVTRESREGRISHEK